MSAAAAPTPPALAPPALPPAPPVRSAAELALLGANEADRQGRTEKRKKAQALHRQLKQKQHKGAAPVS